MPRFVAFLRGVSPVNAKMSDLKRSFERCAFTNVKTVLATGNVAFDGSAGSDADLERVAEAAIEKVLGRAFYTIVRSSQYLNELLEADPYRSYEIPLAAKRVVSFIREPRASKIALPHTADDATVLELIGREVFSVYVPNEKGPVFMKLIEKAFGTEVTTRTWETVKKCAAA
jgi:uncharacterized protein (DUF1697 family)